MQRLHALRKNRRFALTSSGTEECLPRILRLTRAAVSHEPIVNASTSHDEEFDVRLWYASSPPEWNGPCVPHPLMSVTFVAFSVALCGAELEQLRAGCC